MLDELPSYQAGFLKDRSCDYHLFTVRRIFDEYWNHGQELYIASIDLSKAFDNVYTSAFVWTFLQRKMLHITSSTESSQHASMN
jgi:hypothetical protein